MDPILYHIVLTTRDVGVKLSAQGEVWLLNERYMRLVWAQALGTLGRFLP